MNSNVKKPVVQMGKEELEELVTQVPETLAGDINENYTSKKQKFSAADLWRIQKLKKQTVQRRYTF